MGVWAPRFEWGLSQFCHLVAALSQGIMQVRISIIQIIKTPCGAVHLSCPLHRWCGTVCAVVVQNYDNFPDFASTGINRRFPPGSLLCQRASTTAW